MQFKKTIRSVAALAMAAAMVAAPAAMVTAADDTVSEATTVTKELKSANLDAYYYSPYYYDYYYYSPYYYDYYYYSPYYYSSSYYYPYSYYYYDYYYPYYYNSSYYNSYYSYYDPYYYSYYYGYNSYPLLYTGSSVTPSYKAVSAKATSYKDTITISWDEVKNAKKYLVYIYKDGEYRKVKTTEDTSVTFTGLKSGETYKYLIKYQIKNGSIVPNKYGDVVSATVSCKPSVTATSSFDGVHLRWNKVDDAEMYAVYKVVNGKLRKIAETNSNAALIRGLESGEACSYVVRALVDGEWTVATESDIVTVIAM